MSFSIFMFPDQRESSIQGRERSLTTAERIAQKAEKLKEQNLPLKENFDRVVDALVESLQNGKGVFFLKALAGAGKTAYGPAAFIAALERVGIERPKIRGTVPGRDMTISAAELSAAVLGEKDLGERVGYSTSEGRRIRHDTGLFFVTPKILLRHFFEGKIDEKVDGLFIDEAHNRSVEYDMLCGALKKMRREEGTAPFTVFTSAQVNPGLKEFFDIAEEDTLEVEGKMFDLHTYYHRSEFGFEEEPKDEVYLDTIVFKINQVCEEEGDGDILVFLPGVPEINKILRRLDDTNLNAEVLPLHGKLKQEERHDVIFDRKRRQGVRRVILSTNIAESSYTLPEVRYVIDSCRKKVSYYDPETHTDHLITEFISQDEADQRAARTGRVADGKVFRAVTEQTYNGFERHPQSEIHRVNLSLHILRLKNIGINFEDFPLPEPPVQTSIDAGRRELQALGAMNEHGELTDLGKQMAETSFEPRVARMVIEGKRRGKLLPALVMAAFSRENTIFYEQSSSQDPSPWRFAGESSLPNTESDWYRNLKLMQAAITYGVFGLVSGSNDSSTSSRFRKWCETENVNPNALKHVAKRLKDFAELVGVEFDSDEMKDALRDTKETDLTPLLLTGYADCLLSRGDDVRYARLRGQDSSVVEISRGSVAAGKNPDLCIATEITLPKGNKASSAGGIHPVTLKDVREVLDEFIISRPAEDYDYDEESGTVRAQKDYAYQMPGMDRAIFLSRDRCDVDDEIAATVLIENEILKTRTTDRGFGWGRRRGIIADEDDYYALQERLKEAREVLSGIDEENRFVLRRLEELYKRSGGTFPPPPREENLRQWYVARLKKSDGTYISTVEELANNKELLVLREEDFCTVEKKQEIEELYPLKVNIRGKAYNVIYGFSPGRIHFAYVSYPFSKDILTLTQGDIPVFGTKARELPCHLWITTNIGYSIHEHNAENIKVRAEPYVLTELVFPEWRGRQNNERFFHDASQDLPPAERIEYARTLAGEPVYAYRGLSDRGQNVSGIFLTNVYFLSQRDAQTTVDNLAGNIRDIRINQEQIRQAKAKTELELDAVIITISKLEKDADSYGLPDPVWEESLRSRIERVRALLLEQWTSVRAVQGVEIFGIFRQINSEIRNRPAVVARRRERDRELAPVFQKRDVVVEMLNQAEGDERWNITSTELSGWRRRIQIIEGRFSDGRTEILLQGLTEIEKEIEKRKSYYEELVKLRDEVREMINDVTSNHDKYSLPDLELLTFTFTEASDALTRDLLNLAVAQKDLERIFYALDDYLYPEVKNLREEARQIQARGGKIIEIDSGRVVVNGVAMESKGKLSISVGGQGSRVTLIGEKLVVVDRDNVPLYEYGIHNGTTYIVSPAASAVVELFFTAAGVIRPVDRLEPTYTKEGMSVKAKQDVIQRKYAEVKKMVDAGISQGRLASQSSWWKDELERAFLLLDDITQFEEASQSLSIVEKEVRARLAEQRRQEKEDEEMLAEIRQLYEQVSPVIRRYFDDTYDNRITAKGYGVDSFTFDECVRAWTSLENNIQTCSARDAQLRLKPVLVELFHRASEFEIYKRMGQYYPNNSEIRLGRDMREMLKSGTLLVVRNGEVIRSTAQDDLKGGAINPQYVELWNGNKVRFDFEDGLLAYTVSTGAPQFTYRLPRDSAERYFVLSGDGTRLIEAQRLPAGVFVPREELRRGNDQVLLRIKRPPLRGAQTAGPRGSFGDLLRQHLAGEPSKKK